MKANAPEKLYIISDEEGVILSLDSATDSRGDRYDFVDEAVFPFEDGTFEYTRTDVFIEKACKFLKSYRQDTPDGLGYIAGIINDKTIEDFINYMRGE